MLVVLVSRVCLKQLAGPDFSFVSIRRESRLSDGGRPCAFRRGSFRRPQRTSSGDCARTPRPGLAGRAGPGRSRPTRSSSAPTSRSPLGTRRPLGGPRSCTKRTRPTLTRSTRNASGVSTRIATTTRTIMTTTTMKTRTTGAATAPEAAGATTAAASTAGTTTSGNGGPSRTTTPSTTSPSAGSSTTGATRCQSLSPTGILPDSSPAAGPPSAATAGEDHC